MQLQCSLGSMIALPKQGWAEARAALAQRARKSKIWQASSHQSTSTLPLQVSNGSPAMITG